MADISRKFSEELTYSDAIEKVMQDNGGFAPLKLIYKNIEKYRQKTGKTPDNTIQERVQRDIRFIRIAYGVYALTNFINKVEEENIGNFDFIGDEIVFQRNSQTPITEKEIIQNVRVGQEKFRKQLLKELKKCPITKIDDKKLLVASHIRPWIYSDNLERLNPQNGFLLSPLFDKLFDKGVGLITFTSKKEILISKKLSKENIKRINIEHLQIIDELPIQGREEYLAYHRKYIFQKY
ncbi:MAG: hypothetical protein DWQ06_04475 [Calditrichaeota bacterium]|nr:MAG: hypothetical protein DWQ06_04475 [Calditrichota bacterium]